MEEGIGDLSAPLVPTPPENDENPRRTTSDASASIVRDHEGMGHLEGIASTTTPMSLAGDSNGHEISPEEAVSESNRQRNGPSNYKTFHDQPDNLARGPPINALSRVPDILIRNGTRDDTAAIVKTLRLLELDLQSEYFKHTLASVHFRSVYNWFLFLPSILLTLVGGILSFVASPQSASGGTMGGDSQGMIALSVGIISLLSVFWQSLTKQLNLGARAVLHESAAIALKKLIGDLPFKMYDPDITLEELDQYLKTVNEKFRQALDGTNSVIPPRLSSAFHRLSADIDLYLALHRHSCITDEFGLDAETIKMAACAELFSAYTNFFLFPIALPRSKVVARTAVCNLFKKFKNARGNSDELCV